MIGGDLGGCRRVSVDRAGTALRAHPVRHVETASAVAPARVRGAARVLLAGVAVWALLAQTGCVATRQLTLGRAIWPFLIGTEAGDGAAATLKGCELVVVVAEVSDAYEQDSLPISGADVTVSGPGFDGLELLEFEDGVYRVSSLDVPSLGYRAGEEYAISVTYDGASSWAQAVAANPLDAALLLGAHAPGDRLTVPLPDGYGEEYDQLLVRVFDESQAVTWSNEPSGARDWLEFAATSHTPAEFDVPAAAFPIPDAWYAVSVLGLVRSRDDASFSDDLTSQFSGFTTGSGFPYPVLVE